MLYLWTCFLCLACFFHSGISTVSVLGTVSHLLQHSDSLPSHRRLHAADTRVLVCRRFDATFLKRAPTAPITNNDPARIQFLCRVTKTETFCNFEGSGLISCSILLWSSCVFWTRAVHFVPHFLQLESSGKSLRSGVGTRNNCSHPNLQWHTDGCVRIVSKVFFRAWT